jgi:predicted dehydrogenase
LPTIRFAVVGLGRFGMKRINSILKNKNAELVYVCDIDKEKSLDVARQTGSTPISFENLLVKKDYDVAIIALPNFYHTEFVIRMLDAGHDVWCEKPMATTVEGAKKMLEKSIETRRILKIGSNTRYMPNVIRIKDIILKENLSQPLLFRGYIGNSGKHLQLNSWYKDKILCGGGTLLDNGVHLIDLIRYLVGEISYCKFCLLKNIKYQLEGQEDNALGVYELENGTLAYIHSSWTEKYGYMYFELHYENNVIVADSRLGKSMITIIDENGQQYHKDYTHEPKYSYELELEAFINDYKKGIHPSPTSYDGYRTLRVISASYLSARLGQPVNTFDESDIELQTKLKNVFQLA